MAVSGPAATCIFVISKASYTTPIAPYTGLRFIQWVKPVIGVIGRPKPTKQALHAFWRVVFHESKCSASLLRSKIRVLAFNGQFSKSIQNYFDFSNFSGDFWSGFRRHTSI